VSRELPRVAEDVEQAAVLREAARRVVLAGAICTRSSGNSPAAASNRPEVPAKANLQVVIDANTRLTVAVGAPTEPGDEDDGEGEPPPRIWGRRCLTLHRHAAQAGQVRAGMRVVRHGAKEHTPCHVGRVVPGFVRHCNDGMPAEDVTVD
jgi:hypothetical protein